MRPLGYAFLATLPGVTAFAPSNPARIAQVTRVMAEAGVRLIPTHVAPATEAVLDHILFALKHEGVDLQILAQTVPMVPAEQLRQAIGNSPGGVYLRKACYLWELCTSTLLVERPAVTGSVEQLFDPGHYVTGPNRPSPRWRIGFNGLGTPRYCATVERTDAIQQGLAENILARATAFARSVPADVLDRALAWAYLEETQDSFAIERESPSPQKADAFARLLRKAHDRRELSEDYLVDLHAATITSSFVAEFSFRTAQNWLGAGRTTSAASVTYVPPEPTLARELMDELMAFANSDLSMVDPVVIASVIGFGFVYIHPFMDGNGRLSRFLFHHALCRSGQLPEGMVLPVSSAIAKNLPAYSDALKRYSKQVRDRWTVATYDPERPMMQFNGHESIYRYWNATAAVEFGMQMTRGALDDQITHEVAWLQRYDRVIAAVGARYDVRGPDLANLVVACLNNGNKLAARKRDRYALSVPPDVFDFIEQCAQASGDDEGDDDAGGHPAA